MTALQSLKQILQEHLEVCQEGEAYKAAIEDALYGTNLSEVGIVEWCSHWLTNVRTISETDVDYLRGVQFVNDQWNIIKEKERVENAVIWFTDDFSSQVGVRLWDEIEGHLEIVYEEFDSEEGLWKEISAVNAIDTGTFTKLTEAGKFLLDIQTKDSK